LKHIEANAQELHNCKSYKATLEDIKNNEYSSADENAAYQALIDNLNCDQDKLQHILQFRHLCYPKALFVFTVLSSMLMQNR
jgi:hypothetical protein